MFVGRTQELKQLEDAYRDKLFINDNFKGGFYSLIAQTAQILADNIASINSAQINTRFTNIFTAPDSNTANSVNQIVKKNKEWGI